MPKFMFSLYDFAEENGESRNFRGILGSFPKLVTTTLKDAFIELLLVVIYLFVVLRMSQGKDLIVTIFEPFAYFGATRLIFTTLSIILFSLSMWIIPAAILSQSDTGVFRKHLFFMHRILPMLPLWGFAASIYYDGWLQIVILLAALSLFLILRISTPIVYTNEESKVQVNKPAIYIVSGAAVVILCLIFIQYQKEYFTVKLLYSAFLILFSYLLFYFYKYVDYKIINADNVVGQGPYQKYKINWVCYQVLIIVHALVMFFCIWIFDLTLVAPETLLLFIFSFYVFTIDLIYYLVLLIPARKRRYLGWIPIVITLLLIFVPFNFHHLEISSTDKGKVSIPQSPRDLLTIDEYFEQWATRMKNWKDSNPGVPYPIILISGEGGGSRAGLWLSHSLLFLDTETRGRLRDHIFSMSTVSGSSVGAGVMMSYWKYLQDNPKAVDKKWIDYPEKVFENNYVSAGLLGWLVTDILRALTPFDIFKNSRNSDLIAEEAEGVQRSLSSIAAGKETEEGRLFSRTTTGTGYYLNRDFMSYYYRDAGFNTSLPLCFINTCRSSDGKRGISSPVQLQQEDFLDAIDITRYIYSSSFRQKNYTWQGDTVIQGLSKSISLGSAVNMSEIFPFLSAPVFIEGLGSFVDGGYHDNSGLKTTLELRTKLISLFKNKSIDTSDYQIYIIYFKSGQYSRKYYLGNVKQELPGWQPINVITNLPFTGNATYFEEKARSEVGANFIRFQLDYRFLLDTTTHCPDREVTKRIEDEILEDIYKENKSYDDRTGQEKRDTTVNFPLARWLSKAIVHKIRCATTHFYDDNQNASAVKLKNMVTTIKNAR